MSRAGFDEFPRRIALAIPHCPWDADRRLSLARLQAELSNGEGATVTKVLGDVGPLPAHVWGTRMYEWALSTDADYFLTLQDDAIPVPNFWGALRRLLEVAPNESINLYQTHPAAPHLFRNGFNWYSSADWWVGVAGIMPMSRLREFWRWRNLALRRGAVERTTEDTLLGMFHAATDQRVWHPLPGIVDHDGALKSHSGNDHTDKRYSSFAWHHLDEGVYVNDWTPRNPLGNGDVVPHLGRIYQMTPHWYTRWMRPHWRWDADIERIEKDLVRVDIYMGDGYGAS